MNTRGAVSRKMCEEVGVLLDLISTSAMPVIAWSTYLVLTCFRVSGSFLRIGANRLLASLDFESPEIVLSLKGPSSSREVHGNEPVRQGWSKPCPKTQAAGVRFDRSARKPRHILHTPPLRASTQIQSENSSNTL